MRLAYRPGRPHAVCRFTLTNWLERWSEKPVVVELHPAYSRFTSSSAAGEEDYPSQ